MEAAESDGTVIAEYMAGYFATHPQVAIKAGLHEHDGHVADWSDGAIRRRTAALRAMIPPLTALAALPLVTVAHGASMPPALADYSQSRWDARLALADACAEVARWEIWRPHETNPLAYLGVLDITPYIKRNYAPLPDRLWALISHIDAIPDVLRVAEGHLRPQLALPLLEQSLSTFAGIAHFHAAELEGIVRQVRDSALRNAFHRANRHAITAYHDFIARLRLRLPHAAPAHMLGGDGLVAQLAATDLIDQNIDDLLAIGLADLERNQADLTDIAGRMGMEPASALRSLGAQHPPAKSLLGELRSLLADLHRFLQSQDLVTIPPTGDCLVQETLPYMRFGSAFIDAPGPFEAQANDAYLYLTLPDPQWPADQREAWLAKQSIPGLANTAMHEAWPGHYLQFLHLARAPTMASKVFTCLTFTEGWAHYAEQIPIEAGYHGDDPYYAMQQLSMALLRDCRCIVALRLHTGEFSLDDATRFIEEHAYFPPIRARPEALRGMRDPGYLCYTIGKLSLLRLRDDVRQRHPDWSARTLHDTLLGFGSPPIPLLRELLLGTDPRHDCY